jgi:cytochrome c oxidase subunit 2
MTAADVIHAWALPSFGVKRDAVPGRLNESWFKATALGTFYGQCSELCGVGHGFMPIVVEAVSEQEFAQWLNTQQRAKPEQARHLSRDELMRLGKKTYEMTCAACHQPDGLGIPPLYPALRASSVAVGHPINRHIELILNGVAGSAMQPYREQLSDEEIAALVTYERNAWENNTDEEVQPAEVAQARLSHQQPVTIKSAQAGGMQ